MRRLLKATYAAASAAEARQSLALLCAAADASEADEGTQQLGKRLFLEIITRFLPSPSPRDTSGDFPRRRALGLEAERPNLLRRGRPEWLDHSSCLDGSENRKISRLARNMPFV